MIRAVTNSASGWLIPEGSRASADARVRMLACGATWDALRTPETLGLPVAATLLAHRTDRNLLGPVLHDGVVHAVYWLISPGHTADPDGWPKGCALLGPGHFVAVPNPANPHTKLKWMHMPRRGQLGNPPWLATALWDQVNANYPPLDTSSGES